MKSRAADRYEVRFAARNASERRFDRVFRVLDFLTSTPDGGSMSDLDSAVVVICERGGAEVARMSVSGEAGRAMYERVQADLRTLSAPDFELEWGIRRTDG